MKLPEVETVRTTQSTGKKNGDVKESLVAVKSVERGLSDSGWACRVQKDAGFTSASCS